MIYEQLLLRTLSHLFDIESLLCQSCIFPSSGLDVPDELVSMKVCDFAPNKIKTNTLKD